ncbi:MAG: hypothetical protein B7Y83_18715, partial [Flavobacteriales bacterium 32-34-25]
SQDFQWARQIKGVNHDYDEFAKSSDIDKDGNSYTIGTTESPYFDLDPTIQGAEIIDNSTIQNFTGTYIIKVDKDGNYLWGKTFGTIKRGDQAIGVKIGSDGNIYVLLILQELNSINLGIMDSFFTIIKIAPNGNVISTKKIQQNYGYNNNMYAYSFDLDDQNNIFISGWFVGNITIDSNNPNLNLNSNSIDNFLLKINNSGIIDWTKQFNIRDNSYNKLIVRPDGNINMLVQNSNNYTLYNIDNLNNSIIWQKDFTNQGQRTFDVSSSGITILGYKNYYDTIDVDPSSAVFNISSFNTSFILFLNLNGELVDVKQFEKPTNGDIIFSAVTTDNDGNYFFGAQFKGTIDLDPSDNLFKMTSNGYDAEVFYLKLDSNRNFDSVIKFGISNNYNNCYYIKIENIKIVDKNNYLTGDFMWTCDFNPSQSSVYNLESVNQGTINRDGFILKLGPCDFSEPFGDKDHYFCSSQNPKINNFNPNLSSIKWYDSLTSTNPLNATTPLVDNLTYYAARQNEDCPESPRLAVTAHISDSPQVPTFISPTFCKSENKKLSDIIINGINIKWYDSLTSVTPLTETTILENNITYYASQSNNTCESERVAITATINNTITPSTNSPQTFCLQQNATISDIIISGQNIKWYDTLTDGNVLSNTTSLQNGITYYASQTINGCESERVAVLINIRNTPPPIADANQSFCTGSNPTIANIQVTGNSIKWYDSLNNGSLFSNITNLQNGKTYYASQTVNNCESERIEITVSVVNTPSAPTANTNQAFCKKENATLNNVQISGQNIKWYETNFAAASLPNATLLEDNKTYYASQTVGCESDRTPILIRVYNTPLPVGNNNQLFCIDENATIANLSISGSNLKWYEDSTNGTVLAETILLQNNKTYYATQTLNNCESERLAITVKIQDTQTPIVTSPQTFCI